MVKAKKMQIVRTVDATEALEALNEVEARLTEARKAIARLLLMENARPANLHEDDDYLRRMIRSVQAKRRRMTGPLHERTTTAA